MESDDQNRVSRRRFLHSLSLVGVVGASGSLLVACGDSEDSEGTADTASSNCSNLSDLSEQETKQRAKMVEQLNYVEESPEADRNCANCSLYQKEQYEADCGGCQLFPGPVAAKGYCDSWAPIA